MDDEVKRQAPVMDAIDNKMDSTSAELRTANGKLKKVITQMRSTRHFCIDVILIFIILGISLYLYNQFGEGTEEGESRRRGARDASKYRTRLCTHLSQKNHKDLTRGFEDSFEDRALLSQLLSQLLSRRLNRVARPVSRASPWS